MIVPRQYATELVARASDGAAFIDLKRFTFYASEGDTVALFAGGSLRTDLAARVIQNLRGASVAVTRAGFSAIGGFDEEFVGWGGEDLDFWERAEAEGGTYAFGYLPMIHLWHPAQPRKADADAPAVRRYFEIRQIAPRERIKRLRDLRSSP
jgi:GT2 family glycosyltransferase